MNKEDEFLKRLRATFKVEAGEHLQAMATGLLALEKSPAPEEQQRLVENVFRAAHSLKGAARAVNFTEVESICQSMEDVFSLWKRQSRALLPEALDQVHLSLDAVTQILSDNPGSQSAQAPPPAPAAPSKPAPVVESPAETPVPVAAKSSATPVSSEKSTADETVRITVAKLDERLLEAEEFLEAKLTTAQRAADLRGLGERFDEWQREWAAIQPEVRALRQMLERPAVREQITLPAGLKRLVEFCDWNHDYLRSVENRINVLTRAAAHDQLAVGKLVDDLLSNSKKLLMLPLATLGALLPKVVRDLCRDQNKQADLEVKGEEVEIDKRILEEMKDPLIHLLRNCVDHGVEKPEQRVNAGKSPRATIQLTVSPINGNKVEIVISDDGAGIDVEGVKSSAVRLGVLSREEADRLSEAEALMLIFRADLSTSPIITHFSGRGLGLAIVKEKTEKLGGNVSVESRPGVGTTFRITVPVALATFRGILVQTAERLFVVPLAQVERVARYQADEMKTVEGRETLELNGRAVALVRLDQLLELPSASQRGDRDETSTAPVFIAGTGDQRVAFIVDAVLDEQEVLVKRLRKPLSRVRNIAGATVLGSGEVAPILNVADLLKSARRAGAPSRAASNAATPQTKAKSVLIAEDSITSRMLLKGILESAGYLVKTAVDGLEAFAALRSEPYDLIISDVEMPRLNGFDLTARIRADKKLSELPVILVTALETREDRERGIDVGANAYLVKRSFDQSDLLEAVRRLA
ncbi:MAG TPA: response regulator [Verrucomicrobiae bacterium]|nr:response regulator [Verrucomicrobiae bacterium]